MNINGGGIKSLAKDMKEEGSERDDAWVWLEREMTRKNI